ncbi:MAG: JAB domain-containing protein [Sphingomonas sp.]|uniref:JAB domain-containing protein n=1 Tax=Sphingomonas sp. TaxID=28214 RepID=UPI0035640B3C
MARRRLSDYELQPEGVVHLGDADELAPEVKTRRLKAVSSCASARQDYAWMRAEICVSRRGGNYRDFPTMANPGAVSRFVHSIYPVANAMNELGLVLVVDTKNRPLGLFVVAQGGLKEMTLDMSVILRGVLLLGGTGFFFFHNHPSGEPTPSMEDRNLTESIKRASDLLKVKFLDHIILTPDKDEYHSFFAS